MAFHGVIPAIIVNNENGERRVIQGATESAARRANQPSFGNGMENLDNYCAMEADAGVSLDPDSLVEDITSYLSKCSLAGSRS